MATTKKPGKYKFPNSKQIAPEIEKGIIEKCYLFLGEENGEKEVFINKISTVFFGADPHVVSNFHCESGDILSAASFILESSMFSSKKLAIVHNIDKIISKKDISIVCDIISEIPDSTVVIFTSAENNPPKFFSDEFNESVKGIIFWRMFESELQNHIMKKFKDAQRQADPYAATRIVSLTGRDLGKVNGAIERILSGSTGAITEKIVISLIADEKDINSFEFIDAFFKKRRDALALLKKVIDSGGNELGIIALLQREAEKIEIYHSMRNSGNSHEEAIGKLYINPKNMDDFNSIVTTTDIKKIRNFFILLSRGDYAAKSSRLSSSTLSSPLAELISEYIKQ